METFFIHTPKRTHLFCGDTRKLAAPVEHSRRDLEEGALATRHTWLAAADYVLLALALHNNEDRDSAAAEKDDPRNPDAVKVNVGSELKEPDTWAKVVDVGHLNRVYSQRRVHR